MTLDNIGREPSEAVIDIYIRGFLQQMLEKITQMCPEMQYRHPDLTPNGKRRTDPVMGTPNDYQPNRSFNNTRNPPRSLANYGAQSLADPVRRSSNFDRADGRPS